MPETFGYERRKARKSHQCWWCGENIVPGETYERWMCEDFGEVGEVKCHEDCNLAWQRGLKEDFWHYSESVAEGEHTRGCLCERGHCECVKTESEEK